MAPSSEEKALRHHTKTLWEYCHEEEQYSNSDFILALGSKDQSVAVKAAHLFDAGLAPLIICSGARGRRTKEQQETEAATFKNILLGLGIPAHAVLTEQCSTNTFENFANSKELCRLLGLDFCKGIAVTQPFAVRRVRLTAQRQWSIDWTATSSDIDFDTFFDADPKEAAERLSGEIYRIKKYAVKGDIGTEHIPQIVYESYDFLRRRDLIQ